jgi:hypothetical protein
MGNTRRLLARILLFVLGAFNRHHSTWEGTTNAHLTSTDRFLNSLLDLIVNIQLEMTSHAEYQHLQHWELDTTRQRVEMR